MKILANGLILVVSISCTYNAFADTQLMTCQLQQGGEATFAATSNKELNLSFNSAAEKILGVSNASDLSVDLETVSSGEPKGAIADLEPYSDGGECSVGLTFEANGENDPQDLGPGREIKIAPLTPGEGDGYKSVTCKKGSLEILSCQAAEGIDSTRDLGKYLPVTESD
jgi:hypothetical protein